MLKKLLTVLLCCITLFQGIPVLGQAQFTNQLKSYGVIDDITSCGNALIGTNSTGHIIMSSNKGASWHQVTTDDTMYRKVIKKDNTVLVHGLSRNAGIALYENQKWQSYTFPHPIVGIGTTSTGFTMVLGNGNVLTSPTGQKDTWTTTTTGANAFTQPFRKMYYINGTWAVLGSDSILYTTKDFKTKTALDYTVVRDILLQNDKLFLISEARNNPIITLDASFKEIAISPTTKDRSITDKGAYSKLISINGNIYAVGTKGGIVDCNKTLVGTIDQTFYPFPLAVCSDDVSLYVADQGTGLTSYNFSLQTTSKLLDSGLQKKLYQINDELWALEPLTSSLYLVNKDSTITSFPNIQQHISGPEGFFKRGSDYVLRTYVGTESVSKDLKTWTLSEDRIVVDASQTDVRDSGMTLWRLKMTNPLKIGDLMYYISVDAAGTKNNTVLTCILDVPKTETEYIVSNNVGLTITEKGQEIKLGGLGLTIKPTNDKSHTPDRSTSADKLIVLPEKKGETTLNAFSLGIGPIQTIVPFKNNLIAVGGGNGQFMLLEQRKVGKTTEIAYKSRTQFKIPSHDADVKYIFATPDTLYVAINRDVYWSKDGINWESSKVPVLPELFNGAIKGIAYGNGICMVICYGNETFYSTDMKTWNYIKVAPGSQLEEISFSNNKFFITTFEGGIWAGTPSPKAK
nr:hypothetical protein [uncultured Niameybacter sp.]